MNAPVGIAGTQSADMPVNTPTGYTQRPVTGTVQQQQDVQRPATGATPLQWDVPLPQGTSQIQPPPRVQSIDELKDALIQHLLIEHTMLSAAVGKTLNWSERDGILYMSVHTPFEVQQLQREKNILTRNGMNALKATCPHKSIARKAM